MRRSLSVHRDNMKIKLLPLSIAKNVQSEESLSEQSTLESIYEIRALVAAIELNDTVVEIDESTECNGHGQVYLKQYEIWLKPNTWVEV